MVASLEYWYGSPLSNMMSKRKKSKCLDPSDKTFWNGRFCVTNILLITELQITRYLKVQLSQVSFEDIRVKTENMI